MSPSYEKDGIKIYQGDCQEMIGELPSESVQCCITSPPYWGLRDYGVDGQLGLEATPEEYVANLVEVFRGVKRLLKDDGTLWLNLGDSYAQCGNGIGSGKQLSNRGSHMPPRKPPNGLKPKDLVGIPWRVAFALQADGWFLRQDIIWAKPAPMPESVKDRCTKSHEYVFLLSKSQGYYFDSKAIAEEANGWNGSEFLIHQQGRASTKRANSQQPAQASGRRLTDNVARARENGGCHDSPFGEKRNKRSVWTVNTKPYKRDHFATFPPKLIEPMILAGCPEGGTVLDPFIGSGTVAEVCRRWGRKCCGIELNRQYVELVADRLRQRVLCFD